MKESKRDYTPLFKAGDIVVLERNSIIKITKVTNIFYKTIDLISQVNYEDFIEDIDGHFTKIGTIKSNIELIKILYG
jgi:hypothetical protein